MLGHGLWTFGLSNIELDRNMICKQSIVLHLNAFISFYAQIKYFSTCIMEHKLLNNWKALKILMFISFQQFKTKKLQTLPVN